MLLYLNAYNTLLEVLTDLILKDSTFPTVFTSSYLGKVGELSFIFLLCLNCMSHSKSYGYL